MQTDQSASSVRNARAEAQAKLGSEFQARVLEPSPPAVTDGPYVADDPVAVDRGVDGTVVLPAGMPGGIDWNTVVADHPELAGWVAARWLGGERKLPPAPTNLTATRVDLHRLAMYAIALTRHASTGYVGLRYVAGGFGTPFFPDVTTGADRQVRVEGLTLIDQNGDSVRSTPLTSLAAAAEFLGVEIVADVASEHDSPDVGDVDAALAATEDGSRFLGGWFGMAFAALEVVRSDAESVDPTRPQLWPGHFDPAIEAGDEDHRATYGASPGDDSIDEPYLYVGPWYVDRLAIDPSDPLWNAPSFTGAMLKLSDFPAGADPVDTAIEFWRTVRDRIG